MECTSLGNSPFNTYLLNLEFCLSEISSSNNSGLILDSFFFIVYSQCISKLYLLIYQLLMDSGGLGRLLCWWSACQKHLWVHWEILNQKQTNKQAKTTHWPLAFTCTCTHNTHLSTPHTNMYIHVCMHTSTHRHTQMGEGRRDDILKTWTLPQRAKLSLLAWIIANLNLFSNYSHSLASSLMVYFWHSTDSH